MPSVQGLLEAEESAARERVEVLREEADRVLAALAEAEEDWEGWVVARQRVDRVLSAWPVPAGEGSAGVEEVSPPGPEPEPEAAPVPETAVSARRTVAVWEPGISPQVLREGYRRVVQVLAAARRDGGDSVMSCQQIAVALGMEPTKGNVEGRVRHPVKRLADRGWLREVSPGRFTLADGPAGGS